MRVHLFPSRTQKLSSSAPTILGGRLPGKIGNANTSLHQKWWSFFCLKQSTGLFLNGRTIPGLPGKAGNANTSLHLKRWSFCVCRRGYQPPGGDTQKCEMQSDETKNVGTTPCLPLGGRCHAQHDGGRMRAAGFSSEVKPTQGRNSLSHGYRRASSR